jgi:hypothetical protein
MPAIRFREYQVDANSRIRKIEHMEIDLVLSSDRPEPAHVGRG